MRLDSLGFKARHSAFTLVELLVVIGIIALLISILLPALNRARAQASMASCKANLKSLGQAIGIYASRNRDSLPPGFMDFSKNNQNPPGVGGSHWVLLLQNTLDSRYGTNWNDAYNSLSNTAKIRNLFLCPDGPIENDKNVIVSSTTHYACHPLLMPAVQNDSYAPKGPNGLPRPYKQSQIRQSASKALLFDSTVAFDTTTNTWKPVSEVPVALWMDNAAITREIKLFTTFNNKTPETMSPAFNLDQSVSMRPALPNTQVTAADVNADTRANGNNIRFRHMKDTMMNVLMADGHVEDFKFDKRKSVSSENVTTFKRRYIYIQYVP